MRVIAVYYIFLQNTKKSILTVLLDCTAEFSLESMTWTKITHHKYKDFSNGGELITGTNEEIFHIGSIDPESGKKSKAIFEYTGNGWTKWPNELPVEESAYNAWGVMRIGEEFCWNATNMTKFLTFDDGYIWDINDVCNYTQFYSHLFQTNASKCEKH